jgi:ferredoxin
METRRDFMKKSAALCAALSLPACLPGGSRASYQDLKTRNPGKALVLWYSQTGLTGRYGRQIACILQGRGLTVEARDLREFDRVRLPDYDLLVFGSPVFYYDIPVNVSEWLEAIPVIKGTPVAAFVSFGGPEGNQHHAATHILELLADRGGVPIGMEAFMNVAAYPTPSWNNPGQIAHRHLPNDATYEQVRRFTADLLQRLGRGETIPIQYHAALRDFLRVLPLVALNKLAITKHTVDAGKCIGCLTCVKKCPTKAINPALRSVETGKCLACFGCINNCPADAVVMEYTGKRLYGFPEFLRRNGITIQDPVEFRNCRLT